MKGLTLITFAYLGVVVGGCAVSPVQSPLDPALMPLSAEQLRKLIPGNTAIGTTPNGGSFVVYYRKDGTQRALVTRGANRFKGTGTWAISKTGLWCSQWNNWSHGRQVCFNLYQVGETLMLFNIDGVYQGSFQLKSGHSRGL